MPVFKTENAAIHYVETGEPEGPIVVWGHGWGQSHKSFETLQTALHRSGCHILVDFPGFGDSPPPTTAWGTADYAEAMAAFIKDISPDKPVIYVSHSFGGRVGIQLAARYPELVSGLFMIAAAGLPRKRPLLQKINLQLRIWIYKTLKKLTPILKNHDWLQSKFGSSDYKNAGPMRAIFVKTVNENLTEQAKKIQCHTALVYGMHDAETPPEIGERLARLIPHAEMFHLAEQDHYSVLARGHHQVAHLLQTFIEKLNT